MDDARYPIGPFLCDQRPDANQIRSWIEGIEALPAQLAERIASLSPDQLETPYREGGWTPRQVVHHLVDSHMNSILRFKLALTEDTPTIRPYDEARWVEQADAQGSSLEECVALLTHLHRRWGVLLRGLGDDDLDRAYYHPEPERNVPLWEAVGTYDWHGRHHLAHIELVSVAASR